MRTYFSLLLLLPLLFFARCSKEEIQRNAVMSAMTSGQWKVVSFDSAGTSLTSGFSGYQFQFKEAGSVDAIKNGTVDKTGTWSADANARTITSLFTNGGNPLALLNGTWKITNNSWTFVEATLIINNEERKLRLEKV
jgi:hypothetical protein